MWKIIIWILAVYLIIAIIVGLITKDFKKGFLWIAYLFDDIDFPDFGDTDFPDIDFD